MTELGAEWVLYVLVILSFISVAVIVERIVFFLRYRTDISEMQRRLNRNLQKGGHSLALRQFESDESPQSVVLREALGSASSGPSAVEEVAAGARGQQKVRLERGLLFLGTLGNNAPFIGLFGTVLGVINAFRELGEAQIQQSGPKLMAAISEALVATAVGLLVAIPAVVAFNYFRRKSQVVLTELDTLVHQLQAFLRRDVDDDGIEPMFESPVLLTTDSSGQE